MTDPTIQALFDAVIADPQSDEPRKRLACRLDALRDPRGEFIRLQLAAARDPDARARDSARRAADAILDAHRASWKPPFAGYVKFAKFLRGFVELVHIDAAQFLAHAAELYALAPIRMLVLTDAKPVIHELARSSQLARIIYLSVWKADLDDRDLDALICSPHLTRLKSLEVASNSIGRAGLEALCAHARELPSLTYVNFTNNAVEAPVERFGEDSATSSIDPSSVTFPEDGRALEAEYGYQAWLHAPSRLRHFPPRDEDLV